jgi:hypothetical protein
MHKIMYFITFFKQIYNWKFRLVPGYNFYWLTWKTYIADISYKNISFYICLKNVIKYIILCIMFKFY